MLVLVCGSRDYPDERAISQRIRELPPDTRIIHGDAVGADCFAAAVAHVLGLQVDAYPAHWERHGKAAGPIRNRQMLDERPDLVLAFWLATRDSKGTRDTVQEALKRLSKCGRPRVEIVVGY